MRTIGVEERRARLGRRHLLATPGRTPDEAAAALVGLHSSDPGSVHLSAWARVEGFRPFDLEAALYERRSLVRMLGMRRTLFVVERRFAAVMDEACTKAIAVAERRRLVRWLEEQRVVPAGRGARWVQRVCEATLAALERRGEATARQLGEDVPELRHRLSFGQDKRWGGTMGVSTRILFVLAADGAVVRARPLGSWLSGQYRWARTVDWLGGPLEAIEHEEACGELVRRYLRAFGPATMTDVRWWTGWTLATSKTALQRAGAVEVGLDDGTGFVAPDDLDEVEPPDPWVAVLPGLDATTMGWKERSWYLDPHAPRLFDRAGNAGPTVWADGRIVGGWTQRRDGRTPFALLERVPRATRGAVEGELARLREWLGDVRMTPRFRTPLETELGAG
jgi:hypothetical protein